MTELNPAGRQPASSTGRMLPLIDQRKCTSCGDCILCCPTESLVFARYGGVNLIPHTCIQCGVCSIVCLDHAVTTAPASW